MLDQHFGGGGGVQTALDDIHELVAVIGNATAKATQREGRADDGRQADVFQRLQRFGDAFGNVAAFAFRFITLPAAQEVRLDGFAISDEQRLDANKLGAVAFLVSRFQIRCVGEPRARRFKADAGHAVAETLAILRLVDGFGRGADHLDIETLQHAHALQGERGVQRRLPAHGGQDGVGALLFDDPGDDLRRDGLDIGRIRQIGIRHDGGRIGIDQNDAIALGAQRLHGLRAGIVEFAGLTDDDRSGADDENRTDVCALWHGKPSSYGPGRADVTSAGRGVV